MNVAVEFATSPLLAAALESPPQVAIVLGSGMGAVAQRTQTSLVVPFHEVPGLATPTVENHRGVVHLGQWGGKRVLVFEGRLHYYEGHSWTQIEQPIRLAASLGVRTVLLTNAAGGIHDDLSPGSFMLVRDHVEWNRPYCWREAGPGARPSPYSPGSAEKMRSAASKIGLHLHEGIYAAVTGPNFETPAEIRALKACGADAVGMSTTREASCSATLGLECAAVSCITNRAAGLSSGPITNEEVLVTAGAQSQRLGDLIEAFLRLL